jgi:hypothetical protein
MDVCWMPYSGAVCALVCDVYVSELSYPVVLFRSRPDRRMARLSFGVPPAAVLRAPSECAACLHVRYLLPPGLQVFGQVVCPLEGVVEESSSSHWKLDFRSSDLANNLEHRRLRRQKVRLVLDLEAGDGVDPQTSHGMTASCSKQAPHSVRVGHVAVVGAHLYSDRGWLSLQGWF